MNKMQYIREEFCDEYLKDIKTMVRDFANEIGRRVSVSGGCCEVWKIRFSDSFDMRERNVPVNLDVAKYDNGETVECLWEMKAWWNSWMRVYSLLDEDFDDVFATLKRIDDANWHGGDMSDAMNEVTEELDDMADRIAIAMDEYIDKALDGLGDICSRWFASAEEMPWCLEDDQVLEIATNMGIA